MGRQVWDKYRDVYRQLVWVVDEYRGGSIREEKLAFMS